MHTCCRIRTGNKSVLRLLIHAEGSTFNAVLETTENVITAATAGVSSKLKCGSRPLQNNWVQQLFSARKQNYNLQPHPALVFIHWTLLTLGKPSAEARRVTGLAGLFPSTLPHSLFYTPWFPKLRASDLKRWGQEYTRNCRWCGLV